MLYYMDHKLPDVEALNTVQLQVPLQIYSKDNKLIATFGEKRRVPIPYNEIPKTLIDAVLSTEDQRYFQHSGVDVPGLGRAAVQLLLTGRKSQGGSTITMQVARSFYLSRQKTYSRKIREILLAIKIENGLSKDKILELYLNKVFFGKRSYGVEAAAQTYYGKHVNELTLDQMAMIAGIPQAPSRLNPLADKDAALKRRNHVLSRMHEEGYIDDEAYHHAVKAPLNASYHQPSSEMSAPYVAELARAQLEQMYGDSIYTDGFKVYTTVTSKLQNEANKAVSDGLLAYDQRHGYRGPIKNLGVPTLENLPEWQKDLAEMPMVNTLEPVAVIEINAKTITVLRKNGDFTIIPWSGLSWARKQIDSDYLGPLPKKPEQIVQPGDLILISQNGKNFALAQDPVAEAGLISLDPKNGAILAMVGGFDYNTSKFNRITHAQRQPGSSFKPFVYSAALDKGFTLSTIINDAPIVVENPYDNSLWRPQNTSRKFYGPTRIRTAIIKSRNLVSIRLLDLMGLSYTLSYLQKFGFTSSQLPKGLSLALGTGLVTPLQMAQGFSVFANSGFKVAPYLIDSIHNSQDQVIYQAKPLVACENNGCPADAVKAQRVVSQQNAFLISTALQDVIKHGTGKRALELERSDIAGKTGTTQNEVDAWFAGYSPDIVTITWMGFDKPQSLHEYGSKAALPIWMDFMGVALKGIPERSIEQPEGVVSMRISLTTGKQTSAHDSNSMFEYFMLPFVPDREWPGQDAIDNGSDHITDSLF